MQRKFDSLSKETMKKCIDEVITRVEEIDGAAGVIAAQDIIDIVTQNLGPEIYNIGIHDAKMLIRERFSGTETELDLLELQT